MVRLATKFAPTSPANFQLAYDAGYRCAEFWLDKNLVENWKSIIAWANGYPMEYALHFPNRGEFSQRHLQYVIDLYHALNCSAMVIHEPMFDLYGQRLFELDPHLRLGIENHDLVNKFEFTDWAEESRWLTLDVEHLWFHTLGDCSLKKLLKYLDGFIGKYADKLIHLHLPGYVPGFKFHRPQYCSRKMVRQVFTLLADNDYDGLIVSETARKYQNMEELQMDLLLHRRWQHEYRLQTHGKPTHVVF